MLSKFQLRAVHVAVKQVGMDDPAYRLMLRNVAKVQSAKDLNNRSFEAVMAVLEESGFRDPHKAGDYWRSKAANQGNASERQVHHIIGLAESCRYDLEALCRRFSGNRTQFVEKLTGREAWQLTEMLKAVNQREAEGPAPHKPTRANRQGTMFDMTPAPVDRPVPAAVPVEVMDDPNDVPF